MRLVWLDLVKIIGTFSVVLGHINSPYGSFIFSWHMPLFFICAGFFCSRVTSLKELISANILRLLTPYLIFSSLSIFLGYFKADLLSREFSFLNSFIAVFVWSDMPSLANLYSFVLWFLPCLFFAKIWSYILDIVTDSLVVKWLIILVAFYIGNLTQLPFAIDESLTVLCWLEFGKYLHSHIESYKIIPSRFLVVPVLIVVSIYVSFGVPVLDVASKTYEEFFVLNFLWSISFVYVLVFMAIKIAKSSSFKLSFLVRFCSVGGMIIYALHPYTNNFAHLLVSSSYSFVPMWFMKFILSLLMLLPIVVIRYVYRDERLLKYV